MINFLQRIFLDDGGDPSGGGDGGGGVFAATDFSNGIPQAPVDYSGDGNLSLNNGAYSPVAGTDLMSSPNPAFGGYFGDPNLSLGNIGGSEVAPGNFQDPISAPGMALDFSGGYGAPNPQGVDYGYTNNLFQGIAPDLNFNQPVADPNQIQPMMSPANPLKYYGMGSGKSPTSPTIDIYHNSDGTLRSQPGFYSSDNPNPNDPNSNRGVAKGTENYNANLADARNRALSDRAQAVNAQNGVGGMIGSLLGNPYGAQFQAQTQGILQDARARQYQSAVEDLRQMYAQLGRPLDPRMIATLRMQQARDNNTDLRNLQVQTTGLGLAANQAQVGAYQQNANSLANILGNTNYLPGTQDLAMLLALAKAGGRGARVGNSGGVNTGDTDQLPSQYNDPYYGVENSPDESPNL